jgi:hypothetical protein
MPAWSHLLDKTVSYKAPSGVSSAGDLTYGATQTASARVEQYTKIVKTSGGEERQTTHRIVTEVEIPVDARVWLPGETVTDSKARRAIAVNSAYLPGGGATLYETLV